VCVSSGFDYGRRFLVVVAVVIATKVIRRDSARLVLFLVRGGSSVFVDVVGGALAIGFPLLTRSEPDLLRSAYCISRFGGHYREGGGLDFLVR
jgi:hypothetical protein